MSALLGFALLYFCHEFQAFHCQPLPARPGRAPAQRVCLGSQFFGH